MSSGKAKEHPALPATTPVVRRPVTSNSDERRDSFGDTASGKQPSPLIPVVAATTTAKSIVVAASVGNPAASALGQSVSGSATSATAPTFIAPRPAVFKSKQIAANATLPSVSVAAASSHTATKSISVTSLSEKTNDIGAPKLNTSFRSHLPEKRRCCATINLRVPFFHPSLVFPYEVDLLDVDLIARFFQHLKVHFCCNIPKLSWAEMDRPFGSKPSIWKDVTRAYLDRISPQAINMILLDDAPPDSAKALDAIPDVSANDPVVEPDTKTVSEDSALAAGTASAASQYRTHKRKVVSVTTTTATSSSTVASSSCAATDSFVATTTPFVTSTATATGADAVDTIEQIASADGIVLPPRVPVLTVEDDAGVSFKRHKHVPGLALEQLGGLERMDRLLVAMLQVVQSKHVPIALRCPIVSVNDVKTQTSSLLGHHWGTLLSLCVAHVAVREHVMKWCVVSVDALHQTHTELLSTYSTLERASLSPLVQSTAHSLLVACTALLLQPVQQQQQQQNSSSALSSNA